MEHPVEWARDYEMGSPRRNGALKRAGIAHRLSAPMQVPRFTDPAHAVVRPIRPRAFAPRRLASVMFVAALALVHFVDAGRSASACTLRDRAARPRTACAGILVAPLLHGDVAHLVSNALPLLVAGTALLYLYPDSSRFVLPAVYLGPGLAGVAVRAAIRSTSARAASCTGSLRTSSSAASCAATVARGRRRSSSRSSTARWCGACCRSSTACRGRRTSPRRAIGVALALALRRRDVPPRKLYSWELEDRGR